MHVFKIVNGVTRPFGLVIRWNGRAYIWNYFTIFVIYMQIDLIRSSNHANILHFIQIASSQKCFRTVISKIWYLWFGWCHIQKMEASNFDIKNIAFYCRDKWTWSILHLYIWRGFASAIQTLYWKYCPANNLEWA